MKARVFAVVIILLLAGGVAAAQDERVGSSLVMVQGSSLTIKTGLPCDQRSTWIPGQYESDYTTMWCSIDNGDYQVAYDCMRGCPSRTDPDETNRGMINDFREYLAQQPGLPSNAAFFLQGKGEDCVGDPNTYLSPAWCLQQYGEPFLLEEFGIYHQSNLVEVKRYPRWETTGNQGLDIKFANGQITVTAPAWDPWWTWYPHPDYQSMDEVEVISYIPRKGAQPTISFGIVVVGDTSYVTNWSNLDLASNNLGEGYAVPLLSGYGPLLIPFQNDPVAVALKPTSPFIPYARPQRRQPPSGPIQVPAYLKVIPSPGGPPTAAGQTAETCNPPDGSMVLSSHYPKMIKQNAVALEGNTMIIIDETGKSEKRHTNADGSVSVEAPIKGIPTKAGIDAEVGYSSQLLANGKMGYCASGPITYDERKWLWYRTKYHWVAVKSSSSPTGFIWRLDYFQIIQRIGLQREYNQHAWDGYDNLQEKPFIGTITGWRSKGWVWVPESGHLWWYKPGHWEYRSVYWPYINGEYKQMMYLGHSTPDNPFGDTGLSLQIPPYPIFRQ